MEERNEDHYRFRPRAEADGPSRDRCPPNGGGDQKRLYFLPSIFEVAGARMLDLFAGTGQMGLEAIAAAPGLVTLVEKQPVFPLRRCGL